MKFTQFLKTRGAIAAISMGIFYAVAMLGILQFQKMSINCRLPLSMMIQGNMGQKLPNS